MLFLIIKMSAIFFFCTFNFPFTNILEFSFHILHICIDLHLGFRVWATMFEFFFKIQFCVAQPKAKSAYQFFIVLVDVVSVFGIVLKLVDHQLNWNLLKITNKTNNCNKSIENFYLNIIKRRISYHSNYELVVLSIFISL